MRLALLALMALCSATAQAQMPAGYGLLCVPGPYYYSGAFAMNGDCRDKAAKRTVEEASTYFDESCSAVFFQGDFFKPSEFMKVTPNYYEWGDYNAEPRQGFVVQHVRLNRSTGEYYAMSKYLAGGELLQRKSYGSCTKQAAPKPKF